MKIRQQLKDGLKIDRARSAGSERRCGLKIDPPERALLLVSSARKRRVDLPQRAYHPLVRHVHVLLHGVSSGSPRRRRRLFTQDFTREFLRGGCTKV